MREEQDDMGCGEALLLKFLLAPAPSSPPCTYYPPSFPLSLRSAMRHMYLKCWVCSFSYSSTFFSSPVLSIKFTWYPNHFPPFFNITTASLFLTSAQKHHMQLLLYTNYCMCLVLT